MAEVEQHPEANTDIASTRRAIFQVRKDIAAEKENDRLLTRELLEKQNWLRGYEQLDEETLKARGVLRAFKEKRVETESLRRQLAESHLRFKKLESDLSRLKAITFSTDQVMGIAIADYRESLVCVEELQQQQETLSKEKDLAVEALNKAQAWLNRARAEKRRSLSLAEVSKASEDESSAKRQVDELESLAKNLDEALGPIPAKIAAKQSDLHKAEATVWNAKLSQLLLFIQESPEFIPFFAILENAFAAWVMAGRAYSIEQFLKEFFVGGKLLRIDHDSVTAQQAKMANEMGLAV